MRNGEWIDLRSDTVTRPSAAMRTAMAEAEVGDDVYGEDPTVNRLEARAAEMFGKEAALFVPTGTMGNTIAAKLHTRHGEEIVCEARSHLIDWELSMMAWFAGCIPRVVTSANGLMSWQQVGAALRPKGPHNAPTTLVWLENTHNMAGGTVYPVEQIGEICHGAHGRGLKVHMDGARVFNAASAVGAPVSRITQHVDSVMFCLSKGLGAPVGSLLVGTAEAMEQGRLYRKRLGGGMRQAGILAAAGLMALEQSPQHLPVDHQNARFLAEGLARMPGIEIDADAVRTNIIIFDLSQWGVPAQTVSQQLKERGILANGINATYLRMVTHRDVSREECALALVAMEELAARHTSVAV